ATAPRRARARRGPRGGDDRAPPGRARVSRPRRMIAMALVALGAWQLAGAGWIHAKALVAQHLIASAWRDAQGGATPRRPWPWADLRPVARLTLPARRIEVMVLDAASPRALAFGPALVGGTA